MNKPALTAVFVAMLFAANAQNGNNICVYNAMNVYNGGGSPDDLERGMKCSDEAAVNESTVNDKKTWLYRGELYTHIATDTVLRKKYGTACIEAIKAFKKLYDLNDPKFKDRDWDEVYPYLFTIGTATFNTGVDLFQAGNYAQAFQYFYSIKDLDAIFVGRHKTGNIVLVTALKNAGISAERANDVDDAVKVYKDEIALIPDEIAKTDEDLAKIKDKTDEASNKLRKTDEENKNTLKVALGMAYKGYAASLKKAGKPDEAKKVIDEGLAKLPTDANLLVEKINVFLENSDYTAALTYVNSLLALEPNNDGALFIKGLAYEKIGNEDSVVYYYTRSTEANPKNIKPWNNLGAWFVNKANAMVEQMNKLGTSDKEMKEYNDLLAKRKALYLRAKPYLLKAQELDPSDSQIKRTLSQINGYTSTEGNSK